MASVTLTSVVKRFGLVEVINDISLQIADGEFCVLVGPSGCGKTTLLRMIAGLETSTRGAIAIGDRDVNDVAAAGPRHRDGVPGLRPLPAHDGGAEHGLRRCKMRALPKPRSPSGCGRRRRCCDMEPYLDRKPRALSGGQRQRVAMGRAMVREPKVFLMDEPLSNLDAKLRVEIRAEIKQSSASSASPRSTSPTTRWRP